MGKLIRKQSKALQIFKALLVSYIITLFVLVILAFILYKLEPPSGVISVGIIFAYIVSCFVGGIIIGKSATQKRFIWGMVIGILYFLIILLVSLLMNKNAFGDIGSMATVFIMCTLGGMLGGMVS